MLIWLNYNLKKNLKICKITSNFANILNDDPPLLGVEPRIFNGCRICQDTILIHQNITNARDSRVLNVWLMLPWLNCIQREVLTLFRWKTDENQSQTTISRWVHNSARWYRWERFFRIWETIIQRGDRVRLRILCVSSVRRCAEILVDTMIYLFGRIWLWLTEDVSPRQKNCERFASLLKRVLHVRNKEWVNFNQSCWENLDGVTANFWVVKSYGVLWGRNSHLPRDVLRLIWCH